MFLPINTRIRKVERIGAIDRHGNEVWEVLYHKVPAYIQQHTQWLRVEHGDVKRADAILVVGARFQLQAGDKITLDTLKPEEYRVLTSREDIDVTGVVNLRTYILVKIVQLV